MPLLLAPVMQPLSPDTAAAVSIIFSRLLELKPVFFKPLVRLQRLNLTDNGLKKLNNRAFFRNRQLSKYN